MSVQHSEEEPLLELRRLGQLAPDSERASRLRARCQAQLASRAGRQPFTRPAPRSTSQRLVPIVVLAVCALYVASLVSTALLLRTAF